MQVATQVRDRTLNHPIMGVGKETAEREGEEEDISLNIG